MRPAVWRFGALGLVLAACGGKTAATAVGNRALGQRDLSGAYWCAIEDAGYAYPRFPCVIRKVDRGYVLVKLAGSQRFRGDVQPVPGGFEFRGELYCPYGDCTQPLHGRFVQQGGELRGQFADARLIVHMVPASDAAFGGISYGGNTYGDPYVGRGYGGATYGFVPME